MSSVRLLILFVIFFSCIHAEEPKGTISVSLISNTNITVDDLQLKLPKEFELRYLKSTVEKLKNKEFYLFADKSIIDFNAINKYRFDLIPDVLNKIKIDLKTEILFILHNENREVIREDGSQDIIVKLRLISVDLNEKNTIDFLEESKLINIKDPAKKEVSIAKAADEMATILFKNTNGVFLNKINRRLGRKNPYLPLTVLSFFDMEKSEFEKNKNVIKNLIKDTLKAKEDSFADQYVEKDMMAQIRFNSIYEANDIVHLLRKSFVETDSAILNSFFIQYSIPRLEPVFKRSLNKRIIISSKDSKKCKAISDELSLKLNNEKIEVEVVWLDDPEAEQIYKAAKTFLSPKDFLSYGNVLVKNITTEKLLESILKIKLDFNGEEVKYKVRFTNDACVFLELEK